MNDEEPVSDPYDLAIVGSGLAGLSAAVQATRLGLRTIVIGDFVMGGQIVNTHRIENYPGFAGGISGIDLVTAAQEQAMANGVQFGFGSVTRLVPGAPLGLVADGQDWRANAVILATGARRRALGVPGEVALTDRGLSACATCDGPLYRDQDVAVIGGGDAAIDEALFLADLCRTVYLITRGSALTGLEVLRAQVDACPTIRTITRAEVDDVLGAERVTGVRLRDAGGGGAREIPVQGVFVYIGTEPATEPFAGVVPTDGSGHVKVDLEMRTEVPGVFAAGECRWRSSRQLASAAGDGVTAAIAAYRWVRRDP